MLWSWRSEPHVPLARGFLGFLGIQIIFCLQKWHRLTNAQKISAGNYFHYFPPPAKNRGVVYTVHLPGWYSSLNSAELQTAFEDFYFDYSLVTWVPTQSCVEGFIWTSPVLLYFLDMVQPPPTLEGILSLQQGVDVLPLNKVK